MLRLILTVVFVVLCVLVVGALIGLGRRAPNRRRPAKRESERSGGGDAKLKA